MGLVITAFKQEAIQGMVMATYTKIFLQFPYKFWFSTEVCQYQYTCTLVVNPFRWHFMLILIAAVIRFGKVWTIQISFRDQE